MVNSQVKGGGVTPSTRICCLYVNFMTILHVLLLLYASFVVTYYRIPTW